MILITGGNGFLGSTCFNHLRFINKNIKLEVVKLPREAFESQVLMCEFLQKATHIIHFAGINRNHDHELLYDQNVSLTEKILSGLKELESYPRFINISSVHEGSESAFGKAKEKCRIILESYYKKNKAKLISFITPNIFGPFCKPNYNSFVATFAHNLIHNIDSTVENDRQINLMYSDDLINEIIKALGDNSSGVKKDFNVTKTSISEVYEKFKYFKTHYYDESMLPNINSNWDLKLFNTFRSYIPYDKHFPKSQRKHVDNRGYFSELVKSKSEGQTSISSSGPGIERGNHFHTRKIERFQILEGSATVQLRKIDSDIIKSYKLSSDTLDFIDIPIWHTHNLINNSKTSSLLMLFWISEHYNEQSHDTYPLKVNL